MWSVFATSLLFHWSPAGSGNRLISRFFSVSQAEVKTKGSSSNAVVTLELEDGVVVLSLQNKSLTMSSVQSSEFIGERPAAASEKEIFTEVEKATVRHEEELGGQRGMMEKPQIKLYRIGRKLQKSTMKSVSLSIFDPILAVYRLYICLQLLCLICNI